jgi:hypothetical protein
MRLRRWHSPNLPRLSRDTATDQIPCACRIRSAAKRPGCLQHGWSYGIGIARRFHMEEAKGV